MSTSRLTSKIQSSLSWYWETLGDAGELLALDANTLRLRNELASGVESGQADVVWHSFHRQLSSAASETFDLQALTRSVFGQTISLQMVQVRRLIVLVETTTTGAFLEIGNAPANAFFGPFGSASDTLIVPAGSDWAQSNVLDGWDVDATQKDLKIDNPSPEDVTYSIAILGATATDSSSSSGS